MSTVHLVMTVLVALLVALSGLGKIRRDPRQVKVIHTVGVLLVLAAGALAVRALTM
jgi:hypothetical protein